MQKYKDDFQFIVDTMTGSGEDEGMNFLATKILTEELCKRCESGDKDAQQILEVTISRFAKFIKVAIKEFHANIS